MKGSNKSRSIVVVAIVVLLAMLTSLASIQVAAADPVERLADPIAAAQGATAAGDHAAAAKALERAIELHGWSSSVLHGLGSAYLGAGQHGRAILALERASLLEPRDQAIASALADARNAAGVTTPRESRLHDVLSVLRTDEWTWIALGAGVLACIGTIGLAWRVRRDAARILVVAGAVTAGVAGTAAVFVEPAGDLAIVVAGDPARLSPFPTAEPAFEPLPGETVHVEHSREDFVYVRSGDRAGWMPRVAVETIVPSA